MEAFLRGLLPRLMPADHTFGIHAFQGKPDLLGNLEARLRGYATWLPEDWRIVVMVDRDDSDCLELKRRLEEKAANAPLRLRSTCTGPETWQVVNRVVIEELEAWYFGDWAAVREAYPRVHATIPQKRGFRDPDAITGGTWEAFERILKRYGYFETGLRKVEAARAIGAHADPDLNLSRSFLRFRDAILDATA